ncbi:MAG: hypothetical protein RJS97_11505 [Parvibaculaceae bacterium]
MLDAGMQARGKAHMARVLGKPQYPRNRLILLGMAFLAASAGLSYFVWPEAPGDDQLGRLTVLSACQERTPGQAWLEARSAAGAEGAQLTAGQRRAAMDYLLGGEHAVGCESLGSPDGDGEPLAFSEGD